VIESENGSAIWMNAVELASGIENVTESESDHGEMETENVVMGSEHTQWTDYRCWCGDRCDILLHLWCPQSLLFEIAAWCVAYVDDVAAAAAERRLRQRPWQVAGGAVR
jgi:hypothetical protein